MNRQMLEERLRELVAIVPPASLRERVLSAAVVAERPITWSDRVWFSRRWRLAAATIALACAIVHQINGLGDPREVAPTSPATAGFSWSGRDAAVATLLDEFARTGGGGAR